MKKFLSPGQLALLLILGAALLRLAANLHPALLPGATPCVALAFISAVYLPQRWSWLVGVASIMVSELAFLRWNYMSEGHSFSPMILVALGFYVVMGLGGLLVSRRAPLALLFGGPILGSLLFYVLTNTISWWSTGGSTLYSYPQNFAGWVQANTTGWPGYPPTWTFLRNGLAADLFFTAALLALFDPARLALGQRTKPAVEA